MLWRHLCLVRAGLAAGLVSGLMLIGASTATAQTQPPTAADPEPSPVRSRWRPRRSTSSRPARPAISTWSPAATVRIGFISRFSNRSTRRLNVIIPPGLVAASTVGQGGPAAGGGCRAWGWAPSPIAREPSANSRAPAIRPACSRSGRRRSALARGRRPRRRNDRADHSRRLPQLRLADPDAARHVHADGRRGIQPRTRESARRSAAWRPTGPATGSLRPSCGTSATTCRSRRWSSKPARS